VLTLMMVHQKSVKRLTAVADVGVEFCFETFFLQVTGEVTSTCLLTRNTSLGFTSTARSEDFERNAYCLDEEERVALFSLWQPLPACC
jgi:hypothetical protein